VAVVSISREKKTASAVHAHTRRLSTNSTYPPRPEGDTTDQRLIIQAIDLYFDRAEIDGQCEHSGRCRITEKFQPCGRARRRIEKREFCERKSPYAEGKDRSVIGFDCKSGGFYCQKDAPVGLARKQRRSAFAPLPFVENSVAFFQV